MPYGITERHVEVFRRAREFCRTQALLSKDPAAIAEARQICEDPCSVTEDDWQFDEEGVTQQAKP